jgi:hypothetical protein
VAFATHEAHDDNPVRVRKHVATTVACAVRSDVAGRLLIPLAAGAFERAMVRAGGRVAGALRFSADTRATEVVVK